MTTETIKKENVDVEITTAKKEKTTKKVADAKTASKSVDSKGNQMAIIRTGSKQYIVRVGDILKIEKIDEADIKDNKVTFDEVLLIDDGKSTKIGEPLIPGAKVVADVIEQIKDKKVTVIKYRAKSRYFKKNGHRQLKTFVRIAKI